jgi:uncharacterized membrane protein (DUF106 family)
MNALVQIVVWLSALSSGLGSLSLGLIGVLPGWLSATIIAAVTGAFLLLMFKYTSAQRTIKRVRNDINAHLLSLKLFKDSAAVALRAQGRILYGALKLFALAVVPMLVMIVPVTLLLSQLALWYQHRPLRVGEEAVVTLKLSGDAHSPWPEVRLQPSSAFEVAVGPVRVQSTREICWNVVARQNGSGRLVFRVAGTDVDKEFAVGDHFMRVSEQRPGWSWWDTLLHPWEPPFRPGSPVQSIEIVYPARDSWTSGTDWWVGYWFVVSMVAAFCFRPLLNVNI